MIQADPMYGAVVANYPSDRRTPLLISAAILFAVWLSIGLPLASTSEEALPFWAFAATMLLVFGGTTVGLAWWVAGLWNREVVLYEKGFRYREGSRNVYFTYAELRGVRRRIVRQTFVGFFQRDQYQVYVFTYGRDRILLNNIYLNIDDLSDRIEKQMMPFRRPVIEHAYDNGKTVLFGDTFGLSQQGLHDDARVLAWAQFKGTRMQGGRLCFVAADGQDWLALRLDEIENVMLLLEKLRAWGPPSVAPAVAPSVAPSAVAGPDATATPPTTANEAPYEPKR
jgi:hypothetical protein